ncbi:hypothetical protein ACQSSU_20260 [Micromonospora echinospora]
MATKRPTISAPGGSILDEVTAATASRPAGQPPFARRPAAEATAEPEPAEAQAEPELAVDAEPDQVEEPRPRRRAAAPARTARPRVAARPASRPAAPAGLPPAPPGYVESTKPLQVYLPGGDHWNLKYSALMRGTDMTSIVAALVSAYTHDPGAWHTLMERAEEERVPLGELIAPALAEAIDAEM